MTIAKQSEAGLSCPLPIKNRGQVTLAHGGGGTRMRDLIDQVFMKRFRNPLGDGQSDAALLSVGGQQLAFTTDSFVVDPPFFPGGDIGSLAVHGTVNDLAMSGARPCYLSASYILEEGFELAQLERIVDSMQRAAEDSGVVIVTGDTKVVERHHGDGIYINTAGIGILEQEKAFGPMAIGPGDHLLVNGDLGRHGMAIVTTRAGFELETAIESDSAPLWPSVRALMEAGIEIHCLRDLTRGGLASALVELSTTSGFGFDIAESRIPVSPDVRGACELLGFDPLHVANEGRMVAFVAARDSARAVEVLNGINGETEAAFIGVVKATAERRVTLESVIGVPRILEMLSGEQLPRIC